MKTDLTKRIENNIYWLFRKTGYFVAFEIQFGFHQYGDNKQYADVSIYNTQKELVCFEIKVSNADFHSKAKKTFVGHKNYYAMPLELYEKVKDEIPEQIGVYVLDEFKFYCIKKAKKCQCGLDENTILWSFIRSRTNQTTKDVEERTKIDYKHTLDTIYKHLDIVDIDDNKVELKKIDNCDKELFISLFVSSDDIGDDFLTLVQFYKNYVVY